ncbi:MAG: DUF4350 domain-containing protein [Pyrinomonadaceae bacterium]
MRGRFLIFLSLGLLVAALVALNGASYVRVEQEADLEAAPDRSTSNAGATGARALYEYLEASGTRVARWRESADALVDAAGRNRPATLAVIGPVRREFTEGEAERLLEWVSLGGRLVLIDRAPDPRLLPPADNLRLAYTPAKESPPSDLRADDVNAVTAGSPVARPAQPTLLTVAADQIAPSRFASRLYVHALSAAEREAEEERQRKKIMQGGIIGVRTDDTTQTDDEPPPPPPPRAIPQASVPVERDQPLPVQSPSTTPAESESVAVRPAPESGRGVGPGRGTTNRNVSEAVEELEGDEEDVGDEEPMGEAVTSEGDDEEEGTSEASVPLAPVLHFTDERGALVADYRYGAGRILVLSDPFVIANNGIGRADNLQLAVNLLDPGGASAAAGGLVAFDEYHHGRGETHNQLFTYFAGTPVVALCGQLALVLVAVVWTRGRRFARPLPATRVDRRSKLEFVASMAELQQRARAYDLAIENVYGRTRRALARYGGTGANVPRAVIAERVAARAGLNKDEIENLMRACEDAINGQPVSARESLALVARLRELEQALGIQMRSREIRQAETL